MLLLVAVSSSFSKARAQQISKTKLTTSPRYDRNPSFFKARTAIGTYPAGTYWLFFVRNIDNDPNYPDTCEGTGCDACGNCDAAGYEVYYMTSTDNGVTWSTPTLVPPSAGRGHRGMAAFQDDVGKIWVFVSGPAGDGKIHYYKYEGTNWIGPVLVANPTYYPNGITGSHVEAIQARDGKIWVFYQDGGSGVKCIYTSDYGSTWSNKITVSDTANDGIPKAFQDSNGKFHVVMANWAAGGEYHYATSTDGLTWTAQPVPVTVPGTISCDPVIFQDADGDYWLFYAPWDGTSNSQWIESVWSSDGVNWMGRTRWTKGGNSEKWWDMWPEIYVDEGKLLMFYTSEEGSTGNRIDGNIWLMTLQTSTAPGTVKLSTTDGLIEDFEAVDEATLPSEGKPPLAFPHGFFSFKITGLTPGQTVTVTIKLPSAMPPTTLYWKYHVPEGWIDVTSLLGDNDGDNILTLTLTDGGLGDDDGTANGVIVDQGGPGVPPVGGVILQADNPRLLIILVKVSLVVFLIAVGVKAASRRLKH